MIDTEVFRLRRLRNKALEVRAIARALEKCSALRDEPLLNEAACSAWRVARTVSGRLIAHPYLAYQRGPSVWDLWNQRSVAVSARLAAFSRLRALRGLAREVRHLIRELDDARALTWVLELSDSFARSRAELDDVLQALESQVGSTEGNTPRVSTPARVEVAINDNWPYLAF